MRHFFSSFPIHRRGEFKRQDFSMDFILTCIHDVNNNIINNMFIKRKN